MSDKIKTPFHLFSAKVKGNLFNTIYPNEHCLESLDEFDEVTENDHVLGAFIGNKRKKSNFEMCDVLYFDIDNANPDDPASDNPETWVDMDDIAKLFPNVEIILKPSRNHMKAKGEKAARPKFHGYCPLHETIEDKEQLERYLQMMIDKFTILDKQVNDCSRLFFGSVKGGVKYLQGDMDMKEFLDKMEDKMGVMKKEKKMYALYKTEVEPLLTQSNFGVSVLGGAHKCPIHNDSKPSFSVFINSKTGLLNFKCFSKCGTGEYPKFIMKRDGLEYGDALKKILSEFHVDYDRKSLATKKGLKPKDSKGKNADGVDASKDDAVIDAYIEGMNKKHALVLVGGDARIMTTKKSKVADSMEFKFGGIASIKAYYQNIKLLLPSGKIEDKIGWMWMEHTNRRTYWDIVFDPSEDESNSDSFNLWRGFAVEPNATASCEHYLSHIRDVVAGGDDEISKYLLDWMADAIQNPATLPGVAVAIRGKEGTGKGTLINNFCKLFGVHTLHVTNKSQFLGNFNSQLKDCLLLYADEAYWSGERQCSGNLKSLITEDSRMIEMKGVDAFSMRNYTRLMMSSNDSWIAPTDIGCRRFFILDCPDDKIGDYNYFSVIDNEMKNGGLEALMYFLLNRDISDVDIRNFPRTKAMLDNTESSMDNIQKYWYEVLKDADEELWLDSRTVEDVYEEYQKFVVIEMSHSRAVDKSALGKGLSKLCTIIKKREGRKSGRPYCYLFPTLLDCRLQFEKHLKMEVEWGDEPEEKIPEENTFDEPIDEFVQNSPDTGAVADEDKFFDFNDEDLSDLSYTSTDEVLEDSLFSLRWRPKRLRDKANRRQKLEELFANA